MADSNFVIRNGLTVNGAFSANSTQFSLGSVSANGTTINVGTTTVNSTIYSGTANNANNLGGVPASSYTNTSGAYTFTGIHTYSANIVVGNSTVNTQLSNGAILVAGGNVSIGNSTVNTQFSNSVVLISNSTSTTSLGLADLRIGNTTSNVIIANTTSSFGGNVTITGTANITGAVTTGNTVTVGTASYFVANGNVGIGNSAPTDKLRVEGTLTTSGAATTGGNITTTATEIKVGTGVTEEKRFRLNNSARDVYFYLNTSSVVGLWDATGSAGRWTTDTSGNFTATGNITAYSDIRLKANIGTIEGALDKVKGMRGVSYNRLADGTRQIGLIAQEVVQVIPEAVHATEDGMLSVAYGNLVGLLIEAIKELSAEIDSLKNNSTCNCGCNK